MVYYVIKFISESYTLQEETMCDVQIIIAKITMHELYSRQHKVALVKITTTEQYSFPHFPHSQLYI